MGDDGGVSLPPGFRFCPTDEELILHFLYRKASRLPCHPNIIPELDLYLQDPWKLNGKALCSGNQYYFFSQNSEDRVTENGFWKQVGAEEAILSSGGTGKRKVGIKKLLVFCTDEAPVGLQTNWVMQEYHLCNSGLCAIPYKTRGNRKLDSSKWILCRVQESKVNSQSLNLYSDDDDDGTELSGLDEMFLSLADDLDDISSPN